MSDSAASQRIAIENSLQAEADGSFLIRPFSIFGTTYEFPNQFARDCYISLKITSKKVLMRLSRLFIVFIFILHIVPLVFTLPSPGYISQIQFFIWSVILAIWIIINIAIERRDLRIAGARPVSRTRWHGPTSGAPFASSESGQLGGIFILMVALSALLSSILLASYFGPPGRDAGMPYLLILIVLAACASLAIAIWHELWKRDRRKGASKR